MFENNLSDPSGWSLGKINNLREVFGNENLSWKIPINLNVFLGNNSFLWFFPVKTTIGDGLSYPCRNQEEIPSYQDAGKSKRRINCNNNFSFF